MPAKYKNLVDLGGLVTNTPEDKVAERNATDILNIDLSIKGMIQTKKGYEIYGKKDTTIGVGSRSYIFKKNFGTIQKVKLRVVDDGTNSKLQWHNASNTEDSTGKWEDLLTGLTTGTLMGFAPANGNNSEKVNLLIFCNGVDSASTWNGATATVASVTANTIVCNETLATSGSQEGFTSTGNAIVDGTTYAYTGITAKTFTGVTPDPTFQSPSAGDGVTQETATDAGIPIGNVLLTTQRKLFVAGVADNESKVHYSTTADVTDFTITTGLGSGGTFDVMEGGGKINLLQAYGKNGVIIQKNDAVIQYLRDTDGTNALETFNTISEAEDVGASNIKAESTINRESFYCTLTEGLKSISQALNNDDLNIRSITDRILPTISNWTFSSASVIYDPTKRAIHLSALNSDGDRRVISYYINTDDISIDDEPANDFFVVDKELYFVSSVDMNAYKMYERNSAKGVGRNHRWTSKEFTLDEPAQGKTFHKLYVERFIANRTKIKVTILYGLLGSEGEQSEIIAWNDKYVGDQKITKLGTDVLGTVSLGAVNAEILNSFPFNIPLHFDIKKSGRYKIRFETEYDDETDAETYWAISNVSTNPTVGSINYNKVTNTNV